MSELQLIEQALRRTAQRRRWQNAFGGFAFGLFVGGALWLLVLGLYKLAPLPALALPVAGAVAVSAVSFGCLRGLLRPVTLTETARWVDVKLQLKERLSTALELSRARVAEEWTHLVLTDAAAKVQDLDPQRLVPWRLPKAARWAALVSVLGVGLGFVPEYRTQAWQQKQQDEARLRETGRKLAELTRKTLVQKPPALPPVQKAMTEVAEMGDRLAEAKLTRSEAMRDLASLADKLAQQSPQLGLDPAVRQLEKTARENSNAGGSPEEMQKQMAALQEKLGNGAATADKLDQLQKSLEKIQQAAAGLSDKDSKEAAAQRERLAQELSNLARQAKDMGLSVGNLDQAIEALKAGQTDLFLRDLDVAMQDLEKLREMAKSLQQLQQQMAKLGKDLGEQLQNGQIRAAQATLQRMIDQLKSSNLTPEQQQNVLEEVMRAAAPAAEYGKVKDHLEMASQQMRQGRKADAAQSLAQARRELDNLLQQMADAQAMMGMLDALARAEAAIAMNKSWDEAQSGICKNCGGWGCEHCQGRQPGWGHGGKPGPGVGTWADDQEGGWTRFDEPTGMPDNAQVKRPDFDPRGHTDRPDDLNPNLMPTKVRGQMSPGGSMPSITLKGVSIKGTSNVKFEEAATAAQAEAENALSQDKIPRAYQGAVRDYFDDLKK